MNLVGMSGGNRLPVVNLTGMRDTVGIERPE